MDDSVPRKKLTWKRSTTREGDWYTNVHHGNTRVELVRISRDYLALTSTTWWTVEGTAGYNGRSCSTLRAAKRLVEVYAAQVEAGRKVAK